MQCLGYWESGFIEDKGEGGSGVGIGGWRDSGQGTWMKVKCFGVYIYPAAGGYASAKMARNA